MGVINPIFIKFNFHVPNERPPSYWYGLEERMFFFFLFFLPSSHLKVRYWQVIHYTVVTYLPLAESVSRDYKHVFGNRSRREISAENIRAVSMLTLARLKESFGLAYVNTGCLLGNWNIVCSGRIYLLDGRTLWRKRRAKSSLELN